MTEQAYKMVSFSKWCPDPGPTPGGVGHTIPDTTPGVALCGAKLPSQWGWVYAEAVTCEQCENTQIPERAKR